MTEPSARMIRRLLPAAVVLAAALTGCASGTEPDAEPSAAFSTSPSRNQVECVNIDRAHNAWANIRLPSTAADVAAMNRLDAKMAMDDGDAYLRQVEGYQDQASRALAAAIAEYNLELSIVNAQIVIGRVEDEQAVKVEQAVATVAEKYQSWRSATCS